MLDIMSQDMTVRLSELSVSAFTSLPEIILGLAVVTTYGHIKTYCLHKKQSSLTWAVLFGIPTLVFAGLTVWTLTCSSLQVGYALPAILVATRVLAGYVYGFLSMLFALIGEPDYADLVTDLKAQYADLETNLTAEIDCVYSEMTASIVRLNSEIDHLKTDYLAEKDALIARYSTEVNELSNQLINQKQAVHKLSERAASLELQGLENYPIVTNEWLKNGLPSVTLEVIARSTGHSKRKILAAKLKTSTRNKSLYLVSSVVEWLRNTPAPITIVQDETDYSNIVSISEYQEMEA
jgi:hypothetical protein